MLICRIIRQLIKYNGVGGSFSVQYRQLLESQGVLLSLDDIQVRFRYVLDTLNIQYCNIAPMKNSIYFISFPHAVYVCVPITL